MKIKRFYAKTMRAALQEVREEQGPDSVILSKRRVADGIEVIAAVDYDEALLHQSSGINRQTDSGAESTYAASTAAAGSGELQSAVAETAPPAVESSSGVAAFKQALKLAKDMPIAVLPEPHPEDQVQASATAGSGSVQQLGADSNMLADYSIDDSVTPSLLEIHLALQDLQNTMQDQFAELRWDELQRQQPHLAEVIRRLTVLGLSRQLIQSIVEGLTPSTDQQQVWRNAIGLLAKSLPLSSHDVCDEGGMFAITGATGSGKTTSIAKLATRFALKHGTDEVGLVTTDGLRIGAQEHLFRFGKILGVPVQVATSPQILKATLDQLSDKKLVLIDTAGFSPRDPEMYNHLRALIEPSPAIQTLLTLAANTQTESLQENIRIFDRLGLDGAIVTKLDEATSLGGLLCSLIEADLTICYVSDGQQVPEDLQLASRYRAGFVSHAVSLARQFANDRSTKDQTEPSVQESTPLRTPDNRLAIHG